MASSRMLNIVKLKDYWAYSGCIVFDLNRTIHNYNGNIYELRNLQILLYINLYVTIYLLHIMHLYYCEVHIYNFMSLMNLGQEWLAKQYFGLIIGHRQAFKCKIQSFFDFLSCLTITFGFAKLSLHSSVRCLIKLNLATLVISLKKLPVELTLLL